MSNAARGDAAPSNAAGLLPRAASAQIQTGPMFDDSDRPLEPGTPVQPQGDGEVSPAHAEEKPEVSPAQVRFLACRWHTEVDEQKYCSNRDVLPYAGKGGFDPEAWCPDCTLYKLRRTPRKRPRPEEDDYPY